MFTVRPCVANTEGYGIGRMVAGEAHSDRAELTPPGSGNRRSPLRRRLRASGDFKAKCSFNARPGSAGRSVRLLRLQGKSSLLRLHPAALQRQKRR